MSENIYDNKIHEITSIYGYVVNKETYDIEHINSNLKRELAIAQDDDFFIGKKCYRVIYKAKRPCEFCNMQVMKLGETQKWYKNHKKYRRHILIRESLQEIDGKICFVKSIQNATDDFNQLLNQQNIAKLDFAVKACTKVLTDESDLKASNEKLLKIVSKFYSADSAYIYEFDENINSFLLMNTHYSDKTSHKVSQELVLNEELSCQLETKPFVILTEQEYGKTDIYKALSGSSENDLLLSALKTNDSVTGIVGINNYDDDIINFELVSMVSSFVSNSISIDKTKNQLNSTLNNMEEAMSSNMVMIDCVKALIDGGDTNVTGSIKHLLTVLQNYYECDRAYFFEFDMVNGHIKNVNEQLKKDVKSCMSTFKELELDTLKKWFEYIEEHGHISIKDCKTMVDSTVSEYKLVMKNNVDSIIMVPLYMDNALCGIMGVENVKTNFDDISLLKSVSAFVVSHLNKAAVVKNLEELSFNDELTGLYNRNFYITYVEQLSKQTHKKIGIIFADVNGLKKANDNFGHEFGDVLIKWCANFLRKNTGSLMFRVGGDELICFFENVTSAEFDFCIRRLEFEMNNLERKFISFGSTWRETNTDIEGQIAETDLDMYQNKQKFYEDLKNNPVDEEKDLLEFKETLLRLQSEI